MIQFLYILDQNSFVEEGKLQKSKDSHEELADKSSLENTMGDNPWLVRNVQAFSFLNCPECTFKVKAENLFQFEWYRTMSIQMVMNLCKLNRPDQLNLKATDRRTTITEGLN